MTAGQFLRALFNDGRLILGPAAASLSEVAGEDEDLLAVDHAARLEMAGEAAALVPAVARWAAQMLYDCCCCYAYRSMDAEKVTAALARPCPADGAWSEAQRAYAADLALRYLPDLLKLSRGLAAEDPLVTGMIELGKAWPLSSVGIPEVDGCAAIDDAHLLEDAALRELYLDRIITREAVGRLRRPAVAALARGAIGLYPALAPKVAGALLTQEVA